MSALHLQKRIESETLHLPELRRFLGKTVEITISETLATVPNNRWEALRDAAGAELLDADVVASYREFDRQAQRPAP